MTCCSVLIGLGIFHVLGVLVWLLLVWAAPSEDDL